MKAIPRVQCVIRVDAKTKASMSKEAERLGLTFNDYMIYLHAERMRVQGAKSA